jgi:acyl carrier protein
MRKSTRTSQAARSVSKSFTKTFCNPRIFEGSASRAFTKRGKSGAPRLSKFTLLHYDAIETFNEKARRSMSVRLRIIAAMKQVAEEQKVKLPPLTDELSLHETGFDSLAFAILVARLEDDLGIDPFTISEDAAFPLTVGDFVRAYENVPA